MSAALDLQTATMARVFAEQGHYEKAAEIYRRLLKQDPQRQDLAEALSEIEKRISELDTKPEGDLVSLFSEWIELVLRYKRLRYLMTIKKRM
jgi:pentatricopeptide repeat protein